MQKIFGGPILPTLFKLAVASIVVGILLAFFGIQPIDLWRDFLDTVRYVLLGAVVVIPIWLFVRLWTYLVERK
jgi:ABC-type proline/glycine betaine transport system permease subunit